MSEKIRMALQVTTNSITHAQARNCKEYLALYGYEGLQLTPAAIEGPGHNVIGLA
ncbi:MAG: hypothetical protein AAF542_25490 [Pseudomonadota bacterium]